MGCQCSTFDRNNETRIDFSEPFMDIVKSQSSENELLIYSRTNCEQSKAAKALLRRNKINFEYFELDNMNDEGQVFNALQTLTGRQSTPFVFVKGIFFGSLKELQKSLESGQLVKALKQE
ncbi:unnamed protein product [Blepharisma stoltei]|uniref:Glutaredoxin domain-containing protein n=1 Tax=Blepharisma stoltei TaxID=1481888 RepID=A0AAU9JRP1_9CILI|nr:unnamed protein product [Blepharisma stoltei]